MVYKYTVFVLQSLWMSAICAVCAIGCVVRLIYYRVARTSPDGCVVCSTCPTCKSHRSSRRSCRDRIRVCPHLDHECCRARPKKQLKSRGCRRRYRYVIAPTTYNAISPSQSDTNTSVCDVDSLQDNEEYSTPSLFKHDAKLPSHWVYRHALKPKQYYKLKQSFDIVASKDQDRQCMLNGQKSRYGLQWRLRAEEMWVSDRSVVLIVTYVCMTVN